MTKKKQLNGGLVWSTDPQSMQEETAEEQETLAPEKQKLTVKLDTKQRAGKVVTLVSGFIGREADLDFLGKSLKSKCGTGGSVKDGCILIQGDYKMRVIQLLQQMKYSVKG